MRLTCPNCDAQYEVPDEVMPTSGRDVQCSNCGQTWFQPHPDHDQDDDFDDEAVAAPHPDGPSEDDEASIRRPEAEPERRQLDPAVADILRQEAEAEQEARKRRQAEAQSLESQPDLGLEDSGDARAAPRAPDPEEDRERRAAEARRRMARMRGEPEPGADDRAAAVSSRRELLPNIDEINSSLRSDGERRRVGTTRETPERYDDERKSSFGIGFAIVVVIAAILVAIYAFAPEIAQSVPQADPWLSSYVSWVDTARLWLDGQVQSLLTWLDTMAARSGG